jgi:hypothetical protein
MKTKYVTLYHTHKLIYRVRIPADMSYGEYRTSLLDAIQSSDDPEKVKYAKRRIYNLEKWCCYHPRAECPCRAFETEKERADSE